MNLALSELLDNMLAWYLDWQLCLELRQLLKDVSAVMVSHYNSLDSSGGCNTCCVSYFSVNKRCRPGAQASACEGGYGISVKLQ